MLVSSPITRPPPVRRKTYLAADRCPPEHPARCPPAVDGREGRAASSSARGPAESRRGSAGRYKRGAHEKTRANEGTTGVPPPPSIFYPNIVSQSLIR